MNKKEIWEFVLKIRYPILLVIVLGLLELIDSFSGSYLHQWGNYPRAIDGLIGILTSHFIHSTWGHLASNALPILVLTSILVIFYPRVAGQAFFSIMLGTGVMVWLFARPSYHIGASGMVYGLISFIFWLGIFKKNPKSIVISLIVLILYSGSVEGLFPSEEGVSWESHLFGALVGMTVAFVLKGVIENDELKYKISPTWANENSLKELFLPQDIFEKTKKQRHEEQLEIIRRQQLEQLEILKQQQHEQSPFNYFFVENKRENKD